MNRQLFTPEHEMFREAARKWFQNEVAPHGERWREQGYVDPEMFRKAGEQGYLLIGPTRSTAAWESTTSGTNRY